MGVMGSDVAIETADVALMGGYQEHSRDRRELKLTDLPQPFRVRDARRRVRLSAGPRSSQPRLDE